MVLVGWFWVGEGLVVQLVRLSVVVTAEGWWWVFVLLLLRRC